MPCPKVILLLFEQLLPVIYTFLIASIGIIYRKETVLKVFLSKWVLSCFSWMYSTDPPCGASGCIYINHNKKTLKHTPQKTCQQQKTKREEKRFCHKKKQTQNKLTTNTAHCFLFDFVKC